jgi:filamentous hemagglutinin family protein
MKVSAGSATAVAIGPQLNIRVSDRAILDWRSFNIAPGDTTTFLQPSAASVVWNRINDPNPSKLFGQLNANGVVVLANQAGFYFGPGSVIRAASFVATTSPQHQRTWLRVAPGHSPACHRWPALSTTAMSRARRVGPFS